MIIGLAGGRPHGCGSSLVFPALFIFFVLRRGQLVRGRARPPRSRMKDGYGGRSGADIGIVFGGEQGIGQERHKQAVRRVREEVRIYIL